MRITLIGPGAIGCAVGAALIEAGHDVTFGAHQSFSRLSVQKKGEAERTHPARVLTSDKDATPADWVLSCVKAHQVPSIAGWLRASVGPGTKVAVLQNGVEQRENAEPFVPPGTAITPVVVDLPASRTAPGHVVWSRIAMLSTPNDEAGRAFCALFAGSFVTAEPTDDFVTRAWLKMCNNAPSGAILALTGQPMRVFRAHGVTDLARAILKETIAVARAEGASISDAQIERQIEYFLTGAETNPNEGNSMYADRIAGREMEWNARNGVILRKAARHDIQVPVSAALVPLLAAISNAQVPD
jgi:2-dehydropantoate 2-reductase